MRWVLLPKPTALLREKLEGVYEYPDRTERRLRGRLAEFYRGVFSVDQFAASNSGVANIEMIMQGFLEPGDNCIISTPAFSAYKGFVGKFGASAKDIPLEGDDFLLNVRGILDAVDERTRLVFVTSPNNPTGTIIPKEQVDELIDGLPDHVILVYDEVYYQYVEDLRYVRGIDYVKEGRPVIAVNSFSKAYGLAGLRVGYSYSTERIAGYLRRIQRPFMINSLSMEAAIAALDDDTFITDTVSLIHEEKRFLYQELDDIGLHYTPTQANFILVRPSTCSEVEFEEKLLSHGIMVRTAGPFDAPGCVRVTIGTREANEAYVSALRDLEIR